MSESWNNGQPPPEITAAQIKGIFGLGAAAIIAIGYVAGPLIVERLRGSESSGANAQIAASDQSDQQRLQIEGRQIKRKPPESSKRAVPSPQPYSPPIDPLKSAAKTNISMIEYLKQISAEGVSQLGFIEKHIDHRVTWGGYFHSVNELDYMPEGQRFRVTFMPTKSGGGYIYCYFSAASRKSLRNLRTRKWVRITGILKIRDEVHHARIESWCPCRGVHHVSGCQCGCQANKAF